MNEREEGEVLVSTPDRQAMRLWLWGFLLASVVTFAVIAVEDGLRAALSPFTLIACGAVACLGLLMAWLPAWMAKWMGKGRRITIDQAARTIRFENFGLVESFLPRRRGPRPREFTLKFSEILEVHLVRNSMAEYDGLTILTTRGDIEVMSYMSNFEEICEVLSAVSQETPPARWYRRPWVGLAIILIVTAAMMLGAFYLLLSGWGP